MLTAGITSSPTVSIFVFSKARFFLADKSCSYSQHTHFSVDRWQTEVAERNLHKTFLMVGGVKMCSVYIFRVFGESHSHPIVMAYF